MARAFQRQAATLGILLLLSVGASSCGAPLFWIQKYRDMPDVGDIGEWQHHESDKRTIVEKNKDIEGYYRTHYGKRSAPRFVAVPIEVDESKLVVRDEVEGVITPSPGGCPPGVKLTFAHLSDVQLRDEQVRLYDKETSELADNLIPSFEHHPFVEVFDGPLYYAVVQSINATAKDTTRKAECRPLFMIHTGDAIDAGVMTELYEFIYLSNELNIPWYNAIGNHDIGTFGNIEPDKMYVNDPFIDFMTIHSKLTFINMHHNAEECCVLAPRSPSNYAHDQCLGKGDAMYSKYNGFDRLHHTPCGIRDSMEVCDRASGYYTLEAKGRNAATGDPAIQVIVLDTGFSFGAHGQIDETQYEWLEKQIEKCRDKLVLVFGHHNMETIKNRDKIVDLLARSPAVIAYLCGHKHCHNINYYPGPGGRFGFWEVVTDAIFAYPQQGSLVTISYDDGMGLLDVYAFNHTLRETYIDQEGNAQPSELFQHAELAYLGAVADISIEERQGIDDNMKDRYARLRFPYPVSR